MTQTNWDRAYSNRDAVPEHAEIIARWSVDAAEFRERASYAEIAYGDGPRERMQVFTPHQVPKGAVLFIHGGYWLNFDHEHFSHYAQGCLERGYRFAVPSYGLRPDTPLQTMLDQLTAAISELEGPCTLVGHSAGGHLAAMLAATRELPVTHAVGLSGLYDLRPLINTSMNAQLQFTHKEAFHNSPALLTPSDVPFDAVVGADELVAFRDQNALLGLSWGLNGAPVTTREEAGRNHFTILEDLRDPDSWLVRRLTDSL